MYIPSLIILYLFFILLYPHTHLLLVLQPSAHNVLLALVIVSLLTLVSAFPITQRQPNPLVKHHVFMVATLSALCPSYVIHNYSTCKGKLSAPGKILFPPNS